MDTTISKTPAFATGANNGIDRAGDTEFDYIVVGAGAAGCVLAARLSEDPGHTVLLLEAGDALEGAEFTTPALATQLQAGDASWYWGDQTTPQEALGGRRVPMLAARALGGGSAINTMMWLRGHPLDYDAWKDAGATGWGWADVAPVFRRMEHFELGPDEHHGAGGPMVISVARDISPLGMAIVAAGAEQGLPVNPDVNGGSQEGVGLVQTNTRDGERHSVVDGYLKPALGRRNLTVATGSPVERLLFDGLRVTGVRLRGGREVRVRRSVVLSAGALRSPQLLMLSGIGPADHLREHGIDVVHDLPGVGRNLQDHPLVIGLWPLTKDTAAPNISSEESVRAYDLLRRGPRASYMLATALRCSDSSEPAPDLQYNFATVGPSELLPQPTIGCAAILLTPRSRGTVRLASADPTDAPLVDPRYLTDEPDRQKLIRGLAWMRDKLFTSPALLDLSGPPILPAPDLDEHSLAAHVDAQATSGWHMAGTCRMGTDEGSVVGPDLRVHGVEGLYVADASVMPVITRGNTQAPTIMIAERGADILRSKFTSSDGLFGGDSVENDAVGQLNA